MAKKKINLFKYVSKDPLRPMMNGVFHDDGWRVATDAHILCAIKTEYPKELEGVILDRKGNSIHGNYPYWRAVIPRFDKMKEMEINLPSVRERCKKGIKKAKEVKTTILLRLDLPGETIFIDVKILPLFLDFLECYPDSKIYYRDYSHALLAQCANGDICLIMPSLGEDRNPEDIV